MVTIPLQLPVSQRTSLIQLDNPTPLEVKTFAELQADPNKKVTRAKMKILEANLAYKVKRNLDFLPIVRLVIMRNAINIIVMFHRPV